MILPKGVPPACQLPLIPTTLIFQLPSPNVIVFVLGVCLVRDLSHQLPYGHRTRNGELQLDLNYNHGATICWGLTLGQAPL